MTPAIEKRLQDLGLTQTSVEASTGIPQPQLSRYFCGRAHPRTPTARRIAAALGWDLDTFCRAIEPADDKVAA